MLMGLHDAKDRRGLSTFDKKGGFRYISSIFIFKGIRCVNCELVNSLNGKTSTALLRHLNESQSSRYYWLIQKILYIHARRLGSGQKRGRELTIGI